MKVWQLRKLLKQFPKSSRIVLKNDNVNGRVCYFTPTDVLPCRVNNVTGELETFGDNDSVLVGFAPNKENE